MNAQTRGLVDPLLRGPIPKEWLQEAARLPGKSLHLAILIWASAHIAGNRSVPIGNIEALGFGLERNSKYRALRWLEEAGLISVDRKLGRPPVVTLLSCPEGHHEH